MDRERLVKRAKKAFGFAWGYFGIYGHVDDADRSSIRKVDAEEDGGITVAFVDERFPDVDPICRVRVSPTGQILHVECLGCDHDDHADELYYYFQTMTPDEIDLID